MRREGWVFVVVGTTWIVTGGLIAAVTAHSPTREAMWAAAFLVLVAGVAQAALGAGQSLLVSRAPSAKLVAFEVVTYNAGCLLVLAGVLAEALPLLDVGSALLALSLILLLRGASPSEPVRVRFVVLYRALLILVLLSIPVGLVLARRGS
ncbi:MAG TPA: hypothetical protein VFM71_06580 [Gemmatimonadaceae bacterium]|nr:hypothetical protein [Gemmatimonadaceae bacterium]